MIILHSTAHRLSLKSSISVFIQLIGKVQMFVAFFRKYR